MTEDGKDLLEKLLAKARRHDQFVARIKAALSWYNSVSGSVSRDDAISAVEDVRRALRLLEGAEKESEVS